MELGSVPFSTVQWYETANLKLPKLQRFEFNCLIGKSWLILKTSNLVNFQYVKHSEQLKIYFISTCFEYHLNIVKYQFSIYFKA